MFIRIVPIDFVVMRIDVLITATMICFMAFNFGSSITANFSLK